MEKLYLVILRLRERKGTLSSQCPCQFAMNCAGNWRRNPEYYRSPLVNQLDRLKTELKQKEADYEKMCDLRRPDLERIQALREEARGELERKWKKEDQI
jgi:hypothetical protein